MQLKRISEPITVSVIICTHNRMKLLETALISILKQDLDPSCFETIVVDNASRDGTRDLISSYSENTPAPRIRYVYESHLGSSWARNAGWQAAQGNYIAYIDDDEWAEPDWLRLLVIALEEHLSPVVAVGGPIQLDWGGQRPDWLPVSFEGFYSGVDFGPMARNLTSKENPYTSNLAIHRVLFDDLGGFNTDLGHVGANPSGGEDIEMINRIRAIGKQVFYEPKAVVHHHIPKSRQTIKWFLKRCFYGGMSTPILDNLKHVSIKEIFYNFRLALLFLLRSFFSLIRRQDPEMVENGCSSAIKLGRAVGLIRIALKE